MSKQLSFDLPKLTELGRGDYYISQSNRHVIDMLENWQDWPAGKFLLCGPAGSGKTHLAQVWSVMAEARIVNAKELGNVHIPDLSHGNLIVEDVHNLHGEETLEKALFHLHNLVLAEKNAILFTSNTPSKSLGIKLKDLKSRMESCVSLSLKEPDDELLAAVMTKQFSDRQLSPSPETIDYLVRRMPRSFDDARAMVEMLDAQALATGRPINRTLAREVLDKVVP